MIHTAVSCLFISAFFFSDGSEVVDVKHLKIISIVPLIDDQQKICDVEHTLIPVKMTSEFDEVLIFKR